MDLTTRFLLGLTAFAALGYVSFLYGGLRARSRLPFSPLRRRALALWR
ncbi:hypothetical protein GGD63_006985 [Bradyrhizobium sp. cir1]|nr:hypothetical protein [Bradyrhizobium sp. cir1]MBB4374156.1 hypothetical protein [Bradyrhizobium sp. cir1]